VASLREGRAPLWNPDIYAGSPLLGDGQSMVGSPVTWLHALLPADAAQDAGVWWVLVWTGLGTALLVRRLGAAPWGAALAGAAAMTGPYPLVWLLHPHAATFCWLPWLLWAIERRSFTLAGLTSAGLLAGGHPATAVHGLLIALGWAALRRRWRALPGLLLGGLLAAPVVLPVIEQVLRSTTAAARGDQPLLPGHLLDLLWPGFHGHPARESWSGPGSWADGQLHPGPVVLGLALLGLRSKAPRALVLAWLGLVGLSLLPLPGPIAHARLAGIAALLPAVAAGLAIRERWAVPALVALLITNAGSRRDDQGTLSADAHDPEPAPWTDQLKEHVGDGRVLGLGWTLQPNTGALVGLRDLRGYDLPVSEDTHRLMAALNPRPRGPWYPVDAIPPLPLLRFATVSAVLSESPLSESPLSALSSLDVGVAPLSVHGLTDPLPRAWLAHAATAISDPTHALTIVSTDDAAPLSPPVEGLTSFGTPRPITPVSVEETGPSKLTLSVTSEADALLVVADAWAPGWRAAVDGRPAACLRVGGAFRGVFVPAWSQQVVLRYRPDGWIQGLRLFALGLALLAAGALKRRLRPPWRDRVIPKSPT